ncbi:MAG: hypothetical protein H7Y17_08860, partial [Chlorobia bacterium]|nr:hypothetical protein [Fimbriimonadaceae bacterium]
GPVMRGGFEADERLEVLNQQVASIRQPTKTASSEAMLSVSPSGLPPSALVAGKVTFKTEKANALQVPLLSGSFSKPIVVHWIYQETPVFVNVKDLSELGFLTWVAKAVGARLNPAGKTFNFDLDPIEIRKRAVATIQALPTSRPRKDDDAIVKNGQTFRIACLNALTAGQLTEALATAGASIRLELGPRSPLTNLALQRVRDLEQYQRNMPADSPAPRTAIGLLQRVDRSRMAALIVDSRFGIRLEVPVVDENGRSAGVVRLN